MSSLAARLAACHGASHAGFLTTCAKDASYRQEPHSHGRGHDPLYADPLNITLWELVALVASRRGTS
jgi:hypothetical protein